MEGKASLCFSGPMFYLSLSGPWLEYHGLGSISPGLMTLLIKCVFLGQVACIWWQVLSLQHTFLSCDSRQKGQMQKRNGGKAVDERQLFHGTSTGLVDAICQQNFDWRVCGLHGTSYGKGKGEGSLHQHNQASLHWLRKQF